MNIKNDTSNALQRRAFNVMPLGVNSNFRFWGEGITPYVDKAKGCYLWDVDGNQYIDYRMAFGPIILGHAYDEVDAATPSDRQQYVFGRIHRILRARMTFADKGVGRKFFQRLTQVSLDWNRAAMDSEEFRRIEQQMDTWLAEVADYA